MIDLRSDTFTKPTPLMLEAMFRANVGDDVFSEDPTVNELEARIAEMFHMEAALFCPSGTMTNQIAIKCHTEPGNEVICEHLSHIYTYEGGGIAFNSGCQVKPIIGYKGQITASQILENINPLDIHKPISSLVCIENTSNRGGGSCYHLNELITIREVCNSSGLKLHLDGARIWNALVSKNESPKQYGEIFDSISVCLSKGLGAPIGSLLIGSTNFIKKARRIRKVMGGGMRQAGYMAAAGLFALEHHIDRLVIDHENAQKIANSLSVNNFVKEVLPVETNMIIFELHHKISASEFVNYMKEKDVLCMAISKNQVRMVTHLDVATIAIDKVLDVIKNFNLDI